MGPLDTLDPPHGVEQRAEQLGVFVVTREERFKIFRRPGPHPAVNERLHLVASHRDILHYPGRGCHQTPTWPRTDAINFPGS